MPDLYWPNQTPDTETKIGTITEDRSFSGPSFPTQNVTDQRDVIALPPSFEYGEESAGVFTMMNPDDKVNVGDVLRITYKMSIPFLEDWQTRVIVAKLNADSRFELRHVALNEEMRILVIEVKVIKPFSPAILVPIAIVAVLAGALIWITTLSIERLSTIEVGPYKVKLTPFLVFGGLIVGALYLINKAT